MQRPRDVLILRQGNCISPINLRSSLPGAKAACRLILEAMTCNKSQMRPFHKPLLEGLSSCLNA